MDIELRAEPQSSGGVGRACRLEGRGWVLGEKGINLEAACPEWRPVPPLGSLLGPGDSGTLQWGDGKLGDPKELAGRGPGQWQQVAQPQGSRLGSRPLPHHSHAHERLLWPSSGLQPAA